MKIQFTAKNDSDHDSEITCPGIQVAPKTYTGETGTTFLSKTFDNVLLKKGEGT